VATTTGGTIIPSFITANGTLTNGLGIAAFTPSLTTLSPTGTQAGTQGYSSFGPGVRPNWGGGTSPTAGMMPSTQPNQGYSSFGPGVSPNWGFGTAVTPGVMPRTTGTLGATTGTAFPATTITTTTGTTGATTGTTGTTTGTPGGARR
jgi:hypothetical protein